MSGGLPLPIRGAPICNNNISDITQLKDLVNIKHLYLENNQITDIGALIENKGIGSGIHVTLNGNPLDKEAIEINIPKLEMRGARVDYDNGSYANKELKT